MNNSLAIFVHYSRDGKPCNNAVLYAEELAKQFDTVIIATNIDIYVQNPKISCLRFIINAYDFGYIYQALTLTNAYDSYNCIGLFNDSNYIINDIQPVLSWALEGTNTFCGITECLGGRPELMHINQHHLQSHFLIFKNEAVKMLRDYFQLLNFERYLNYKGSPADIRKEMIINCEILLSTYMRDSGATMASYFDSKRLIKHYRPDVPVTENIHVWLWDALIVEKYPFIKKKVYDRTFPENDMLWINQNAHITDLSTAIDVVKKYGNSKYFNTFVK